MVTSAQLVANRANALRSTGPRTADGKARAKMNAVRHGLFAPNPTIPLLGETDADWHAVRAAVRKAVRPTGAFERLLADRLAAIVWRLRRLARYADQAEAAALIDAARLPAGPADAGGGFGRDPDALRRAYAELLDARAAAAEWAAAAEVAGRLAAGAADDDRVVGPGVALKVLAKASVAQSAASVATPDEPLTEAALGRLVRGRLAAAGLDPGRAAVGLPDLLAGSVAAAGDRVRGLEGPLLAAVAAGATHVHEDPPAAALLDRLAGHERHLTAQIDAAFRQLAAARNLRSAASHHLRERVTVAVAG